MNLLQTFAEHLGHFPFIQKNERQILAVSGGIDSVALSHLMLHAGYSFVMAHCNFQLRGEESDRDEQFVRGLADKYGCELLVKKFDTEQYAADNRLSIQVAARGLRYDWFRQIRNETAGNTYILTAHHADDNIETVIMNFFRGTGLKGLTGMDDEFQKIFRPLLPFRKEEIVTYAKANDLDFVEDSSNANNYYTRNYFRNDMLPAIKKVFPQVEQNLLQNIERLREAAKIYEQAIQYQKLKLLEIKGNEAHIAILKLKKQVGFKTILWEIIKERSFNAAQTDEIIKLMEAGNGSYVQSTSHRVIKNRRWLIIAPLQSQELNANIVIDEKVKSIHFALGKLGFSNSHLEDHTELPGNKNIAVIDAGMLTYPLLLRRWKQGDYFYPLGMQKKKKVSRFLIDQKLSLIEKENTWVLETDKRIIWIVNQRIDDRFKVKHNTSRLLKIHFEPV